MRGYTFPVSRGSTLIEVVISILIVAVVTMSVFSVALVGRQSKGRATRRAAAAFAQRRLLEELKNYITADIEAVPGPGAFPNGWGLPGDHCGCWALTAGTHRLDADVWLPQLAGRPYNGVISYLVTTEAVSVGDLPTVTASVAWDEP